MYHNTRSDIIETDDITELQAVTISAEAGQKVATIKVALDPSKDFRAGPDGLYFHVTNGVQPRMLGPVVPEIVEAAVEEASEDTVKVPVADIVPTGEIGTADLGTDVNATDDTVETSSAKGEKGK